MALPSERTLLPAQRRELFQVIIDAHADPRNYRDGQRAVGRAQHLIDVIEHPATGFFFGVEPARRQSRFSDQYEGTPFHVWCSPCGDTPARDFETAGWQSVVKFCRHWVAQVQNEAAVVDPWEIAKDLATGLEDFDDTPLNAEERQAFDESVDKVKRFLIEFSREQVDHLVPIEDRIAHIEQEVEYLKSRPDRLSKRDVAYIALTWAVNLVTTLGLDEDKRRAFFDLCRGTVALLWHGVVRLLPSS